MKAVVVSKFPGSTSSNDLPIYFLHNVSLTKPIEVTYVKKSQVDTLLELILRILEDGEHEDALCLDIARDKMKSGFIMGISLNGESQSTTNGQSLLIYVRGGLIRFLPAKYTRFDNGNAFFRQFLEIMIVYDSPMIVLKKALIVSMSRFDNL